MPSVQENFAKFLTLLAVLSRVIDSLRNKANNGTNEARGFLVPLLRFLEAVFEAMDSRRGAAMLGEYSAQFK